MAPPEAVLAGRARRSPVGQELLLLVLLATIIETAGVENENDKQSVATEDSSTTEITGGTPDPSDSTSESDPHNCSSCNTTNREAAPRFRVHAGALPWLEALGACRRAGEQLAVPRSEREAQLLGRLLAAEARNITATDMRDALHVGLNDIAREGRWITTDGEALTALRYGAWLSGGAGNSPEHNCGALLADDGRFVPQRCSAPLAYACEPLQPPGGDGAAGQRDGYKEVRGLAMYKLHATARPWAKAAAACAHEGAELATPETEREAGLLAGMMAARPRLQQSGVFIGCNDLAEEGDWRTYDGRKLNESGYTSWAPGEPSGGRAENCGTLQADGHYADAPCSEPRAYYCKKPAPSSSEGYVKKEGLGRYRVHSEGRDWAAALLQCGRENATLAVANSTQEARALADLLNAARARAKGGQLQDYMHVGARAIDGTSEWRTIFGQPLGFSVRRRTFGSYYPQERKDTCVGMDNIGTHYYNPCYFKLMFICKKTLR